MSEWFSKFNESTILKNSNPYRLIYLVLKFAKEHKCPVQRSAFTYWENEIPSRINLGKRKYGGPFTTEEIEDVRTLNFLHLFKLLQSLAGILISSYFIQSSSTTLIVITPNSDFLISTLCHTATVGFLILARVLFSNFCKYYLSHSNLWTIVRFVKLSCTSICNINCYYSLLLISACYNYKKASISYVWMLMCYHCQSTSELFLASAQPRILALNFMISLLCG